jgi:hypothetical protein
MPTSMPSSWSHICWIASSTAVLPQVLISNFGNPFPFSNPASASKRLASSRFSSISVAGS